MNYNVYNQLSYGELRTSVSRAALRQYVKALFLRMQADGIHLTNIYGNVNVVHGASFHAHLSLAENINSQTIGALREIYNHFHTLIPEVASLINLDDRPAAGTTTKEYKVSINPTTGVIMSATAAAAPEEAIIESEAQVDVEAPTSSGEMASLIAGVKLKPEYTDAINSMLSLSSAGKIPSINMIMDEVKALVKVNKEMAMQNKHLKIQAKRKPTGIEHKEYSVSKDASGLLPEGTFKTALAKDIFIPPSGKKAETLNFEVPMFTWEHDHPEVPLVDENYVFNPESLISFLYGLISNKNTWLHGHTGTGKTTFVEQVAARLQWPVIRVNLDNDIERSDFLGQTQLITGPTGATESKFVEGVLPRAMQSPAIFLIDEMDFGKSGIMYVLQRALEAKGLLITEDGGRLIEPHPMFRMVATANTRGQGDELGCYPGARTQSNALLDRFTVWINVDYMDSAQEAMLLTNTFPDTSVNFIKELVTFSKEIRKAFTNRELLQSISPRSLMAICDAREFYTTIIDEDKATKLAIKSCYLQRATEDTVAKVNEISARCFSTGKASAT